MADYKQMYFTLFRRVTTAITLLQDAQRETEEMYLSSGESNPHVLSPTKEPRFDACDANDD